MNERQLLDNAISTLVCAMAFDEALQSGASRADLDNLRGHWLPDAEQIVDEAQRIGLWGDFDD